MNIPILARLLATFRSYSSPPSAKVAAPSLSRESTGRRVGPTLQESVIHRKVAKVPPAWRWALESHRKVRRSAR